MSDQVRDDLHLARVTMTDFIVAGQPVKSIWIAATTRAQAAEAVSRAVQPDWTVELIDDPVPMELGRRVHLASGSVSELSSAVS